MKTILIIADYAASYRGNFIPSIESIAVYLQKHGLAGDNARVVYLFPEAAEALSWIQTFRQEHPTYFLSRSFYSRHFRLADIVAFRRILRMEHVDLIHTHFLFYNYALCFAHYTVARHIPIIGHFHNQFRIPATRFAMLKRWIVEHTYSCVVGVSASVAEGVKRYTNCKDVEFVMNAIAFERLDQSELVVLKDNPSQYVVLMAGWPATVKGVDIAAKAIEALRTHSLTQESLNIKLCIVQSGDFPQTERCIVEALGEMPKWVQLLPPREDIATYYNAADVFISASRIEAFSYCLVEAAYCLPMLACSDIPGPNELLIDGMQFFPSEDIAAAAEAIAHQLLLPENEKDAIRQQRKQSILAHYNLTDWCQRLVEVYGRYIR